MFGGSLLVEFVATITGPIPSTLGNLEALQIVDLKDNELNGGFVYRCMILFTVDLSDCTKAIYGGTYFGLEHVQFVRSIRVYQSAALRKAGLLIGQRLILYSSRTSTNTKVTSQTLEDI